MQKKIVSNKISVLMSIYKNDHLDWLGMAIDSVLNQTLKPDEIILVVDGQIDDKLWAVINKNKKYLKIIQIKENLGLWNALNVGIKAARNELVARMDSDDVSMPDRLEKQVEAFQKDPSLDIVGAQIAEFEGSIDNVVSYRKVPIEMREILKFARFRSPFNHPVVMYKKDAVMSLGGYRELYRTEDYDLWIRMLNAGKKAVNLNDSLLRYRFSDANMTRKTNAIVNQEMRKVYKNAYKIGFLNVFEYLLARLIRNLFHYTPSGLKYFIYSNILRANKNTNDN